MLIPARVWIEPERPQDHQQSFEIEVEKQHIAGGTWVDTQGLSFYCPECAEIWAQILIQDQPAQVITCHCKFHHQSLYWPGGTVYVPWAPWYKLDGELLKREFERHLEIYERHKEEFA